MTNDQSTLKLPPLKPGIKDDFWVQCLMLDLHVSRASVMAVETLGLFFEESPEHPCNPPDLFYTDRARRAAFRIEQHPLRDSLVEGSDYRSIIGAEESADKPILLVVFSAIDALAAWHMIDMSGHVKEYGVVLFPVVGRVPPAGVFSYFRDKRARVYPPAKSLVGGGEKMDSGCARIMAPWMAKIYREADGVSMVSPSAAVSALRLPPGVSPALSNIGKFPKDCHLKLLPKRS